jgi:Holliday junction resolvase RusA-like endonuclease
MPEFILQTIPPSVNAMFANAVRGRIKTRKYKNWIRGELNSLLAQRAKPVAWPVDVQIVLPAYLRGDVDNRCKACLDLLVTAGLIPDDSARFVHEVKISRGSTPRARIIVEPASGIAARAVA